MLIICPYNSLIIYPGSWRSRLFDLAICQQTWQLLVCPTSTDHFGSPNLATIHSQPKLFLEKRWVLRSLELQCVSVFTSEWAGISKFEVLGTHAQRQTVLKRFGINSSFGKERLTIMSVAHLFKKQMVSSYIRGNFVNVRNYMPLSSLLEGLYAAQDHRTAESRIQTPSWG